MNISSQTPEGDPNRCPVCGRELRLEPSRPPGDAPCPSCGTLVWFAVPEIPPAVLSTVVSRLELNGKLIPKDGGEPIPLIRTPLRFGRRESCDICLNFHNVSALHCELMFTDGYWHVRDLNSTNGIRVNGERVVKRVLRPDDVLSIAKKQFKIIYAPPNDFAISQGG